MFKASSKFLVMLLVVALLLGTVASAATLTEAGTYPITTEDVTITVMVANDSAKKNFETNLQTQWMEELTGVKVNWVQVANDTFVEKMNLAFASGDPIDLIVALNNGNTAVTATQVQKYADQGVILPLTDLMAEYAPNMTARVDSVENFREAITTPDGQIYSLPMFNECFHCMYYGKMFVNVLWLENLGLDIPTTTQEFKDMLIAFRDQDANGNGDPNDEIPLTGAIDGYFSRIDTYLISAFIYNDGEDRLMIDDDGKVTAVFMDDRFQEGLAYLNDLYNEGLIYPDTFTQTRSDRNAINSDEYAVFGAMSNNHHGIGSADTDNGALARFLEYVPIAPLVGDDGLQITRVNYYDRYGLSFNTAFIPDTCSDPELVMRWLDTLFTEEGMEWQYQGAYDIDWVEADPDGIGIDGNPATYKKLDVKETRGEDYEYLENTYWGQVFPLFVDSQNRLGEQQQYPMDDRQGRSVEMYLYHYTKENYEPYGISVDNVVPPLYYAEDVSAEVARLKTDINTYVEEAISKFITGQMSLETEWEAFKAQCEAIGLARYLELVQSTYDSSVYAK